MAAAEERDNGSDPHGTQSPFERFERLARRIVNGPKAEVDQKREQEKKRKRKRAAKAT